MGECIMKFLDCIEVNPKVSLVKGELYPYVEMANVDTVHWSPNQIVQREYNSGSKFEKNDTVVARIEPCLQNGKKFFCGNIEKGFGSTEFLVFRSKPGITLPLFVFYLMQTSAIKTIMANSMTGASGRQRVNNDVFSHMEIEMPSIPVQKETSTTLSRFDKIIDNCLQQINLLEESLQRTYCEWFERFRFPGNSGLYSIDNLPSGWEKRKLEEVISLDPKVHISKERTKQFVPMQALNVQNMVLDQSAFSETTSNSGSKFQSGDTLLARISPCLENGKTAYVNCIVSEEGAVGSTEYIVMRALKYSKYMVYLLSRTQKFREYAIKCMSGSDGRQRVKKDKLLLYEVVLPPQEIIKQFDNFAEPIFLKIKCLSDQILWLTEARDLLIPKLVNFKISV